MSADEFAHSPRTLLHIAAELRRRGISPVEVFRQVEFPPSQLLDANRWVSRARCFALGEAAGKVTGDRYFAARIGDTFSLEELGVWGRAIVDANDVAEACATAAKGIGLIHQGSSLRFIQFRRHAQLRLAYFGDLGANPIQHHIGSLAVLRKIVLLANVPEAVSVQFSMPYSRGADCLEETHGSRLAFGCDHDAIIIDRDILDVRLGSAKSNARFAQEPIETAEAIGPLLRELLPYGRANIQALAALQQVSKRTLQRRLKEWGFTFGEILDDIRRTEAMRHVRSGEHSAIEIAFLLGYSDPAHFTRAFRRWIGMSPRDYVRAVRISRV